MSDPFEPLSPDQIASGSGPIRDDGWSPIVPVPSDAPSCTREQFDDFAPKGFRFSQAWRYNDANGNLAMTVLRFEKPGNGSPPEKAIPPLSFCNGPEGQRRWRLKALPGDRPLYNLDQLAARPHDVVLVVEGEKAADAAARRFRAYVVTTSLGGSKAAAKTDWTPLAGRIVVIWPDNDDAGQKYAKDVLQHLQHDFFAKSVAIVAVSPPAFPNSWDLADAVPDGMTAADLASMLGSARNLDALPLPLLPPLEPAKPYPVEALG